jgi:hypothetical protein
MTTFSGFSTAMRAGRLVEVLAHAVLEQADVDVLLAFATPTRSQKARIASGV